jgi:hypothetical protein
MVDSRTRAWWSTMGSGKTAAALWWLNDELQANRLSRALIVAPPLVAARSWANQLAKWAHAEALGTGRPWTADDLDLMRHQEHGLICRNPRAVAQKVAEDPAVVHLVPWHLLYPLTRATVRAQLFSHLVLDESVMMSDPRSKRAASVRAQRKQGAVGHVLELTGLPAPNSEEALWSQLSVLDDGPRLVGATLTEFRERFMEPDSRNPRTGQVYRWRVRADRREDFDKACAGLATAVHTDIGVAYEVVDHWLDLPDEAHGMARDLVRAQVTDDGAITAASRGVLSHKLLQIAQGAVYRDDGSVRRVHRVKIDALLEVLDSAPRGVLLAYAFEHDWDAIRAVIPGARHIREPGMEAAFSRGECKLLCLHPASGAHGVDGLQLGGSTVVWYGVPPNYDHYAQFNARLVRPGQRDTVFIHRLLGECAAERHVAELVLTGKADRDAALRATVESIRAAEFSSVLA